MDRPTKTARALLGVTCAVTVAGVGHAQTIERNLPLVAPKVDSLQLGTQAVTTNQDDTPIAPALSGIVLLGPQTPVKDSPAAGIDADAVPRLDTPVGRQLLKPYLGRRLSRKLIAEVEAVIATYYRREGYPFIALQTPPQEVTSGVVQFRVVEFALGKVSVLGGQRTAPDFIRSRVRAGPGQSINGDLLGEDLDWLARNPFRHIGAVFTPGAAFGVSDMRLRVTETRPWRVYGGYATSGAPSTGQDRYFAGASVLLGQDTVLSYQFTGDDQAFESNSNYVSHAATLFAPIAPRQAVELTLSTVESNLSVQDFSVRSTTSEAMLGYVGALSNFTSLEGDVSAGIEAKRQEREVFFGGASVLDQSLDVYQLYFGWAHAVVDQVGRHETEISLHFSPGDVNDRNGGRRFRTASSGRVPDSNYTYLRGSYNRLTRLGATSVSITSQVSGQYADTPLPDSERIGLGGASLVRGYGLDDGAFDCGLVVRTEMRAAAFDKTVGSVALEPFVFLDAGWGKDKATSKESNPLSTGLGLDARIFQRLSVAATGGYAWNDASATQGGAWRADVRLTAVF